MFFVVQQRLVVPNFAQGIKGQLPIGIQMIPMDQPQFLTTKLCYWTGGPLALIGPSTVVVKGLTVV